MNNISTIGKKCFGCSACKAVCPKTAIKMQENEEGFLVPVIDENKCVYCGKCGNVCPALNRWKNDENNKNMHIYAYKNEDVEVLNNSTSGGFFSKIIKEKKPEWICGCIQNSNLKVEHLLTNNILNAKKMCGSKYVQSDLNDVFQKIKEKLCVKESVLFSGTSCQVHGLLNYLDIMKVPTENLTTVDLICHGVPSPKIYFDFLHFYEKAKNVEIQKHKSRSKKYGWGIDLGTLNYAQTIFTKHKVDDSSLEANLWQNAFFSDFCIRESCYSCPYTTIKKPAEYTIGDFWGVEKIFPNQNFSEGCSLVIVKSANAQKLLDGITDLEVNKEDIQCVVSKQARLTQPIKCPENREQFWQDYHKNGFEYIAEKYFNYTAKSKKYIKIYNILLSFKFYKLADKISKSIFY